MKPVSLFLMIVLWLMPAVTLAQVQEPIIFEANDLSLHSRPNIFARIILYGNLTATEDLERMHLLAETICIPSFRPPWVISIYHPGISDADTSDNPLYRADSTRYVVHMRRAVEVLTPEAKDYRALSKRTISKKGLLPTSHAQEVIEAFTATVSLAHWPRRQFTGLDGEWYHFAAHDDATDTDMWARAWSPEKETRTYKLTVLSEELMHVVEATDDSTTNALLGRIHVIAQEILK